MVANLSFNESTFSGGSYFSKEGSIFIGREFIWDDGVAFSKPPSFHSVIVNTIRMQELDYVTCKTWIFTSSGVYKYISKADRIMLKIHIIIQES